MNQKLHDSILRVFETTDCTERKAVGRERCIELIELCQKLDPTRPLGYYGDQERGFINDEQCKKISELYYSM